MKSPLVRALWLGLVLLPGCGYSSGLRLPKDATSVGIEIFGNDGPLPNVERDLHEQMTRSVRTLVTGQIVTPQDADLVVVGTIARYRRRGGLRTAGNELRETGLLLRVEATLVDGRGRPQGRRAVATVDVGYLTGILGAEEEAQRRALENLADGLVLQLFGEQPPPTPDAANLVEIE